jgi:glutamyl-tRNA reductase
MDLLLSPILVECLALKEVDELRLSLLLKTPVSVLHTCKRLELILVSSALETSNLAPVLGPTVVHEGPAAIRRLFEICAGLKSPISGETAVLGQIKRVLGRLECRPGGRGSALHRLLLAAVTFGKQVREETPLGQVASSWGGRAWGLWHRAHPDRSPRALILGTGHLAEEVATRFVQRGARVTMAGRNLEKAKALAQKIGCAWCGLDEAAVSPFDLVTHCAPLTVSFDATPPPLMVLDLAQPPATCAATWPHSTYLNLQNFEAMGDGLPEGLQGQVMRWAEEATGSFIRLERRRFVAEQRRAMALDDEEDALETLAGYG